MNSRPVAVVVGVGPGLGGALAKRFVSGGYQVALVARREESMSAVQAELGESARMYVGDAADEASVRETHIRIATDLGAPQALLYNAGAFEVGGILDISSADVERVWRVSCLGALVWSQSVLPAMLEAQRGTILFSGATASLRGGAKFAAVAIGKFGLRALAQSMARELGPGGIHVGHVVIDGQIDIPRVRERFPERDPSTYLDPHAIAESCWQLHAQPKSAWTQELDLRPAVEKF